MSEENENCVYYNRQELTGLGKSTVKISEIQEPGKINTINVSGQMVKVNSIKMPNSSIKNYLVIEKYDVNNLTTIDVVYGNLDLKALEQDDKLKKKFFEKVLTRENLDLITRKYFGVLPNLVNERGKEVITIDKNIATVVAKAAISYAYVESRETTVKMNQSMFSENLTSSSPTDIWGVPKDKKKPGFFDALFGNFGTINSKGKEPARNEIENYVASDNTNYTKNEGVLFLRSGSVILNDKQLLKFIYATKDYETGEKTTADSFLIEEFDEERLSYDKKYRSNFVKHVLTPSGLKNARSVRTFPYIGGFNDSGRVTFDIKIWDELNKMVRKLYPKTITRLLSLKKGR